MKLRPNILITNDDGVLAPGIRHLAEVLKEIADITIVAPLHEQSASGLSITIREPIHIESIPWPCGTVAYGISGKPADCVKMALSVVLDTKPDLIVSGINRGSNAGRNIFYSGTVAAVIEGVLHDIPGIALSCCDFSQPDYETAKPYIASMIEHTLEHPLPMGTFLNVNFPCNPQRKYQGVRLARQGKQFWAENPNSRQHPVDEKTYYWLGYKLAEYDEHLESDIALLKEGFVAAVPIQISELTNNQYIAEKSFLFEQRFDRSK